MKNIQKSIRITEEVYNIVNEFEGNGFNEKFSNIVLKFKKEEQEIIKKLDFLKSLETENKKKIDKQLQILKDLERISMTVSSLISTCKNIESNSNYIQLDIPEAE